MSGKWQWERRNMRRMRQMRRRNGTALTLVCIGLTALLACAALAIDVGRVVTSASQVQSVADAAALAAAGENDVSAVAEFVAANNDLGNWPLFSVDPSSGIAVFNTGDVVPGYGTLGINQRAYEVTVDANVPYTFARVTGLRQTNVTRTAVALRSSGGPGGLIPALFAGDSGNRARGVVINGSGTFVGGDITSNASVELLGNFHDITGNINYRHDLVTPWWNLPYQTNGQAVQFEDPEPYPLNHVWDDFLPWTHQVANFNPAWNETDITIGRLYVTGNMTISGAEKTIRNGIALVDGNVSIGGSPKVLENVTIIARGTITMTGHHNNWTPYIKNLAAMSLSTADRWAISVSGNDHVVHGDLFAPNGGINFTGASQTFYNGSLVGMHVQTTGSGHRVATTPALGGGGGPVQISLIR